MAGWVGLEKLMTAEEVADKIGAPSVRTVAGLRLRGELIGVKVGRSWRFDVRDVDDWIERKRDAAKHARQLEVLRGRR
ncbi:helix-turn-helix DNA binding domain protein [Arthrobacter phage Kuleana]|uniref:Helix-turn-helix DNA-binding domain protein n=1 Tax=Arthrobacter phage Kuleana TaxID=2653270 RepID=A0A5Q2W8U1_9CAUD|nr:helix-turn-helix DNA binding domain protein [Arthrobacter phage Kuleana]QGH74527.1 helix-turn-helix DNA-binding domain protein [Arthrobacter phage Kuleana]